MSFITIFPVLNDTFIVDVRKLFFIVRVFLVKMVIFIVDVRKLFFIVRVFLVKMVITGIRLTPLSRVHPEKPTGPQQVKKSPPPPRFM
jgi:hypothetical protein